METFINRSTWFGLSTIGATFLGISVLFSILGIYVLGVDMMGIFKWILIIYLLGTGIIGGLISLGTLAIGLKMKLSSSKSETAE